MKQSFRTVLLIAAALLMMFGALGYAFNVVPDLYGDLVEIGVRPAVVGGTVLHLYFGAIAMFGFTLMVAATYTVFGVMAFSRTHNPHHLGPLAMGVLLGAALAIPRSKRSLT